MESMRITWWSTLLALAALLLPAAGRGAPCDPAATPKARQVLEYLQGLPKRADHRVLSGQNAGHGAAVVSGYKHYVGDLQSQTGKWISMLGVDYGFDAVPADIAAANGVIKQHWAAGGLVTVSLHFANPFTGGDSWDRSGVDLSQLVSSSTAAGAKWLDRLEKVAAGLAELRDAGIVVLWRPLHEMNGDWFWWSAKDDGFATQAEFTKVWQHMFDLFTKSKGLHNLLWVYAPNAQLDAGGTKPTTYYYPGPGMVDVVGLDIYVDALNANIDSNGSYTSLTALGKPFAITEFGPKTVLDGSFDNTILIQGLKSNAPLATYWLSWHSASAGNAMWSLVDNQNASAVLADAWVVSRDQIAGGLPPLPGAPDGGGAGADVGPQPPAGDGTVTPPPDRSNALGLGGGCVVPPASSASWSSVVLAALAAAALGLLAALARHRRARR